jgi:hypothetical protein
MATPGPVDPPYDPREDIAELESWLNDVLAEADNLKARAVNLADVAEDLRKRIVELDV